MQNVSSSFRFVLIVVCEIFREMFHPNLFKYALLVHLRGTNIPSLYLCSEDLIVKLNSKETEKKPFCFDVFPVPFV